ncbi:MAG TPA: hypothetical protein GX005_06330 [Bacteroidales bacterium]|nr:hypothetical protein [Bacteroidales bacterium]
MKLLFPVAEVMKSLSNIIKGQRIRSETTLNIKNLIKPDTTEDKDKKSNNLEQDRKADFYYKLEQAKLQAEQEALITIEKATAKANQIVRDAQIKVEKESSIALENAKNKGYDAGYKEGKLKSQTLIDQGHKVLEEAKSEKEIMLKQLEPEIIEMIIAICQKLTSEEIEFNKSMIHLLIRKALGNMQYEMTDISIKVSPDQYQSVVENKALIIKDYANPADVEILQEADLNKGTCIIETPFGSIECNLDSQFDEIKKQMRLLADKE